MRRQKLLLPITWSRIRKTVSMFLYPISIFAISVIASVIGTYIAILYFSDSRRLLTRTNPARRIVSKANQVDKLRVNFDAIPINDDISIIEVAIWNQGNLAIKKSDLLQDVVISTADKAPILAASIPRVSRQITGLRLNTDGIGKGSVVLTWDILEKNDGAEVELTYVGDSEMTAVVVDGIIVGQGHIDRIESTSYSALTIWKNRVWWVLVLLLSGSASLGLIRFMIRSSPVYLQTHWPYGTLFFLSVLAFAAWLVLYFLSREPTPPV
jgi:hypothetical protein